MKKQKKKVFILLASAIGGLALLALSGCSFNQITDNNLYRYGLSAPKVSVLDDVISWEKVGDGITYNVYNADTDELITSTADTEYQFPAITEDFKVYVVAVRNGNLVDGEEKHADVKEFLLKDSPKSETVLISRNLNVAKMQDSFVVPADTSEVYLRGKNQYFYIDVANRTTDLTIYGADLNIGGELDGAVIRATGNFKLTLALSGNISYLVNQRRQAVISAPNADVVLQSEGYAFLATKNPLAIEAKSLTVEGAGGVYIGDNAHENSVQTTQTTSVNMEGSFNVFGGIKAKNVEISTQKEVKIKGRRGTEDEASVAGIVAETVLVKEECTGTVEVVGGEGYTSTRSGENGGNGAVAIQANLLTVSESCHFKAIGGKGGNGATGSTGRYGDGYYGDHSGDKGGKGGDGGSGGNALAVGKLIANPSNVVIQGGAGGNGGAGGQGGEGDSERELLVVSCMSCLGAGMDTSDMYGGDGGDGGNGGRGGDGWFAGVAGKAGSGGEGGKAGAIKTAIVGIPLKKGTKGGEGESGSDGEIGEIVSYNMG